jgi:hypothetical protein
VTFPNIGPEDNTSLPRDSTVTIVYVYLTGEAVDAWRPVEASDEGRSIYRLSGDPVPEAETWAFAPGSRVRCEMRDLADGPALVAVELA